MALSPLESAALLVSLAALCGYANHHVLRLAPAVGQTLIGALLALALVTLGLAFPQWPVAGLARRFVAGVDFPAALMNWMLAFLLFAGALHVDWAAVGRAKLALLVLSTVGVVLSTALVAGGLVLVGPLLGLNIPLPWALVFGALISPTDPVAVLAIIRRAAVPPALQALLAAESLFNDGVGVVVFGIVLGMAVAGQPFDAATALTAFAHEALGGALFGLALGWLACRIIGTLDHYPLEVMISLALALSVYALAARLGLSGPVAVACSGLVLGSRGLDRALSEPARDYLLKFWELVDEMLNAVLFLLIGLECVALQPRPLLLAACLPLIALVLAARWLSVALPLRLLPALHLGPLAMPALVWGGLRGGIPIALALALPPGPHREPLLMASFVVVLFSVVVQGGSVGWVMKKFSRSPPLAVKP